jgi:hypothetical protein
LCKAQTPAIEQAGFGWMYPDWSAEHRFGASNRPESNFNFNWIFLDLVGLTWIRALSPWIFLDSGTAALNC